MVIVKIISLQAQIESLQESAQVWVNAQLPNHSKSDREVLDPILMKEFQWQISRDRDR